MRPISSRPPCPTCLLQHAQRCLRCLFSNRRKTNKQTNELSITTTLRIGIGMGGPDKKITEGWRNGVDPELK
jgi:hypothetical protein